MHKDYEKVKAEYIQISADTRNKLTVLSASIIAAIYVLSNNQNHTILVDSLLLYFLTMFLEVISVFLKSQHYSLWFDEGIDTIDLTESWYGRLADWLFLISLAPPRKR